MSPRDRRTLAQYGRRGDRVRVLIDSNRSRIEVLYRDADGIARKRIFANSKEGRTEAETWAETYHTARALAASGAQKEPVTVRELWERYTSSPAYHEEIREATRRNYRDRWRHWEVFIGPNAIANETTLYDIDRFRVAAREAGLVLNSIRNTLNVVRVVYNWATTRKLISHNEVAVFRWKQPKDAVVFAPEEYTEAEFGALLKELSPQSGLTWRTWTVLMLAGHQGQRARAVLNLRWSDVDYNVAGGPVIRWPAEYQKQGVELVQPMMWETVSALRTAREWRERSGYEGPWVLYAGGGNKSLGAVLLGAERGYRKDRTQEEDTPYTYQAMHRALMAAERRAKVAHKPHRALHGLRKMVAGNVADRTGDDRMAMEWIGDRDMGQARTYLKRRNERLDRAAEAASGFTKEGER